jgi:hypothetical protein
VADKRLAEENSPDTGNEVTDGIGFQDVARAANVEGGLDEIAIPMLTQEEDFGTGRQQANLARRFKTIHSGQADIHQNYVRPQCFGFPNRLQAIPCDATDIEVSLRIKMPQNESLPRQKIINYKNLCDGHP